jgi:hypothetical protein
VSLLHIFVASQYILKILSYFENNFLTATILMKKKGFEKQPNLSVVIENATGAVMCDISLACRHSSAAVFCNFAVKSVKSNLSSALYYKHIMKISDATIWSTSYDC